MSVELFLAVLVLGFGTARLAALITKDEITEPLRDKLFSRFPHENTEERDSTFIGQLFSCYYCLSIWIAAINYALYWQFPFPVLFFNTVLAIAYVGAVATWKGGWR